MGWNTTDVPLARSSIELSTPAVDKTSVTDSLSPQSKLDIYLDFGEIGLESSGPYEIFETLLNVPELKDTFRERIPEMIPLDLGQSVLLFLFTASHYTRL
jgi:hypothetical protein